MARRKKVEQQPDGGAEQALRLDKFLKNVGIVKRREHAQEACRRGLVEVDGRTAKPATQVRVGQTLTVRLGMKIRQYRVLQVPQRPVARAERAQCVELIDEQELEWEEAF